MKNVFVSFDLENTTNLYDDFYEKAEKIGLKKYIMGQYVSGGENAVLPNTTLHGNFPGNSEEIRDSVRREISNIFKELNVKGKSLVVVSETWGTN